MKKSQESSDGSVVFTLKRESFYTLGWILLAAAAQAQPVLHLRGWDPDSSRKAAQGFRRTRRPGRSHFLVQFTSQPGTPQLNALTRRGVTALSYVPDFTLSISMRDGTDLSGLGIHWMGQLRAAEKISPLLASNLTSGPAPAVIVEFYSDVLEGDARAIAAETGVSILENPDLLPHHLLIEGTVDQVRQLADWDEVSYIFPASPDLVRGVPVYGCAGALTSAGPVAQAVPLVGAWAGATGGSASLNYAFVAVTSQDPQNEVESEIERAYAEWAKYVQVTFTPSNNPDGPRTLAVLFANGAHGDGYPFTTPSVLAHTFYPYPLNPESIAGHQHFNDAETWRIGADVDVFSVALHETGHALGLGHSDNPADVMYPYYKKVSGLSPDDIAAGQQLYAPVTSAGPAPPVLTTPSTPLSLTIQPPASTTTASSIALTGTVSGGSGSVAVSWSTNQGASGMAQVSGASWSVASIPLSAGPNVITVTAQDAALDVASASVTVTSQLELSDTPISGTSNPGTTNSNPPATPSPGSNSAPPSLTILSPSSTFVSTSASSIVVNGTAQDSLGITQVTWTSSTGGSGVATGTSTWSTGPIPLYEGMTTIMIYATDTAGNQAWRSIMVEQQ
jgi:hypothetical protein